MTKKYYASNLTEIRPDTKLIEAKLRQYFEITQQRYEPQRADNTMFVSFEALSMLAANKEESRKMNDQWHAFVSFSVGTHKEGSIIVSTPFAANYLLPTPDGLFLAAEINWNTYESLNNHRSHRHHTISEEQMERIRTLHQQCKEQIAAECDAVLAQLKEKYAMRSRKN